VKSGIGIAHARALGAVSLASLLATGCVTPGSNGARSAEAQPRAIVAAYYEAINRRDLLALPAYVAPDVTWYSIIDGERLLEVDSREALAEAFTTYFARFPETSVRVEAWLAVGTTVAVRERTGWSDGASSGGGERLGVFELEHERIVRVTYFLPGADGLDR
jgi:ketosteroid isomerase-like protein